MDPPPPPPLRPILLIYLSSHENHLYTSPNATGLFLSNLYWLTLIMLPKRFKTLARSDVVVVKTTYKFIQKSP